MMASGSPKLCLPLLAGDSSLRLGSIKTTPISSEEGFFGDGAVTALSSQFFCSCHHCVAQQFAGLPRKPDTNTNLCLKKPKQLNPSRTAAQCGYWFNLDAGPAIIVPAQGAVQHRIPKEALVKLVTHLTGVTVKILLASKCFPQGKTGY